MNKKWKQFWSILLIISFIVGLFPTNVFAVRNESNFLAPIDDPDASAIQITTAEELAKIKDDLTASYVLMNDIDLSSYGDWTPIGRTLQNAFCGKLDGQGHKITGLTVTQNSVISQYNPIGLFGVCNGAQIKNVAIENANLSIVVSKGYGFSSGNINSSVYAGTIAGYALNNTVIYNCYTSGNVLAKSYNEGRSDTYAGGLIGYTDTAVVSYSYNHVNVEAYNGDNIEAHNAYAGGLIGAVEVESVIDRAYNSASVTSKTLDYGNAYAGGLTTCMNNAFVTITDCFNEGKVQSFAGNNFCDEAYAGGIVAIFSGFISRVYNSGKVIAQAKDTWGIEDTTAYAGGICGSSSSLAKIDNVAMLQSTVSADASDKVYQYCISYGGVKNNNIVVNSITSNLVNDANIIENIENMKSANVYENTLGWDFVEIWEIVEGKDFPQLRQVDTKSELYNQEYIEQHLAFINSDEYLNILTNYRWAQIYWSDENNFSSNAAGVLYDATDTLVDLVTLNFGDLFEDNDPFKVILADYIADQSVKEVLTKDYIKNYPLYIDKIYKEFESFVKLNWDEIKYGKLYLSDLKNLFRKKDEPFLGLLNKDFEQSLLTVIKDEKKTEFGKVLGVTGETLEEILNSEVTIQEGIAYTGQLIDFINGLLNYSASLAAYRQTDEKFQLILKEMCNNLSENTNVEKNYKKQLKEALESYIEYDSGNVAVFELNHYFEASWKEGAVDFISVFLESKLGSWLENVLTEKAFSAYNAISKAVDVTWKVVEYVTKNGEIQECREMLRANAYFENAMYCTLRSLQNRFEISKSLEDAYLFDAAFKFFKETQICSMDIIVQYLDTYQTSWVAAIKNNSTTFMNSAIEEVHINKLFLYNNYCHGMEYTIGGKVITIACPTDVYVYDEKGNLIASIENNVVVSCEEGISAYIADSVKVITVPSNQNYTVKINATDNGIMSYSVSEYDANMQNIQKVEYSNIIISKDEVYIGNVNNEIQTEPSNYNLMSNNNEIIDNYNLVNENNNIPVESIEIKSDVNVLKIGESSKLEAVISPENATVQKVVWSSSDNNIISVTEEGKITALSTGVATISVQSIYGRVNATISLTVSENENIPIIELSSEDITVSQLTYNGKEQLPTITVSHNETVLKENVDYTITGLTSKIEAGKYSFTVNGINNYTGTIIKNFIIEKAEQEIIVSSFENIILEGKKIYLSANTDSNVITYTSSNPEIITVDNNGLVTAILEGTAEIIITAPETENFKEAVKVVQIKVISEKIENDGDSDSSESGDNDIGNSEENTGNTSGSTGESTGNTGGSTGESTGNTGGSTGSSTGESTGNTGGSTGSSTGGSTGGSTGSNTGGSTGSSTGSNLEESDNSTNSDQDEKMEELDIISLKKPIIKSISSNSSSVLVKWNKVTEAEGYYIYRKTGMNGKWKKVKKISNSEITSWKDKSVKNGTRYAYKIYAYCGDIKSPNSSAKVIYYLSKPAIQNIKLVSEKVATIKYKINKKASGYQIQYSTSSKFVNSKTKTVTVKGKDNLSKKLKNLNLQKKYYVRVRAYKTAGGKKFYSNWSNKKVIIQK